jgi:hypothetical protein
VGSPRRPFAPCPSLTPPFEVFVRSVAARAAACVRTRRYEALLAGQMPATRMKYIDSVDG